jgi:trk system potassium uptake protein TrkA
VSAAFSNLPADFKGRICDGDALNQEVMHRAGIENADALAAVTSSDTLNMAVGHIGRSVFHVPNVVVRNYEPGSRPLFEVFGLQVVSSTGWGAQRIEEMIVHPDVRTVYSAGNGEVEIYQLTIPLNCVGRPVGELLEVAGCVVVSVTRGGRAFLPDPETRLEEGDVIHLGATFDGIEAIRTRLCA